MKHLIPKSSIKHILLTITFLITLLVTVTVYLRVKVENLKYLSSPLCILLGNLGDSQIQRFFTVFVSILLVIIMFVILILYVNVLQAQKKSFEKVERINEQKQNSRKTVTFHIIAV